MICRTPFLFPLGHPEDFVDGFLISGTDEGAGVDDDGRARSGRSATFRPQSDNTADMTSVSTRFFGQPRLTMYTLFCSLIGGSFWPGLSSA